MFLMIAIQWIRERENIILAVIFPVIAFKSTSQGQDSMNAITVRITGRLIGKPELPPLIIDLCYFQNAQTFTPSFTPAHPFFLLAVANHLITALFYSTTTNDFACLLTTFIVNNLRLMLLYIADQLG